MQSSGKRNSAFDPVTLNSMNYAVPTQQELGKALTA
jgi:hypothetical protein